jgi:hypothetical protein
VEARRPLRQGPLSEASSSQELGVSRSPVRTARRFDHYDYRPKGPAGRARRAYKGPARPPLAGREKRFRRGPKPALPRATGRPYRHAYLDRCFGASKAASRAMSACVCTSVFEYGHHGATRPGRKGPYKEGVATGVAPGSHYGVDLDEQGVVCGQRPGLRFEGLLCGQRLSLQPLGSPPPTHGRFSCLLCSDCSPVAC